MTANIPAIEQSVSDASRNSRGEIRCQVCLASQNPKKVPGNNGNASDISRIPKYPTGANMIRVIMQLTTKKADRFART